MSGIGYGSDWECAVVTGYAYTGGGYELPDDKSMRGGGLDCRRCGCRRACAGSGESRGASDIGKLCGRRRRDDGKRAVVGGDADSRDSHGLSCGETMRGSGIDGYEKTVFGGAAGASGDRDGSGLRGPAWARGNGDDYIFIDNGGASAGAALADAIEIRVVELARQVVAGFAVADGQVLPAKKCGGVRVGIGCETGGDAEERSRCRFLVEHAVGVENHGAQHGVERFVGLDIVDRWIAGQRPEKRLQTRPRRDAAVAEDDVLAIGRHSVRQIRWGHICDQPAEDLDGRVK